jgi:hypothetical protein
MGIEVLKRVITHEKKHGVKPSSGKPIVASDITMKPRWEESMDGFYPWLEKKK